MAHRVFAVALTALVALTSGLAVVGCRDDTTTKADQQEQIASSAGLGTDVAAFLALATRATDATYTVSYATTAADSSKQQITVTQRPPDRRVDIFHANGTIDSTIRSNGTTYQCAKTEAWQCGPLDAPAGSESSGVLAADTVAAAVTQLTQRATDYDFAVSDRDLAGVTARCLVTTRKPGKESDPSLGASGTLCVAPSGAPLLVDVPSGTLTATAYSTDIAADAFTLPASADATSSSSG